MPSYLAQTKKPLQTELNVIYITYLKELKLVVSDRCIKMNQSLMNSYLGNLFSLKGRVIIVTNVLESFGATVSEGLALSGATTYSLGNSSQPEWKAVENEHYVCCDSRDLSTFQVFCEEIYQKYGRLNTVINPIKFSISLEEINHLTKKREDAQKIIEANFKQVLAINDTVVNFMKKSGGGSIINIVNISDIVDFFDSVSYISIKNALTLNTKKLAIELIKENICLNNLTINCLKNNVDRSRYTNRDYNHRLEELIGTTIFFASKNSRNITGQNIFHFL